MSISRQSTPYSVTVEQAAPAHPAPITPSNQASPSQSDSPMDTNVTLPDIHAPNSAVLGNPGTASTQTTENPLLHLLASTPIHIYRPPQAGIPTPMFRQGRDRFPTRPTRFHAPSTCNPHQYEVLPGPLPNFDKHWNSGRARRINDSVIVAIRPEPMYSSIHYRIHINATGWGRRKVTRGDIVNFRGFMNHEIKYLVTWERAHNIEDGFAYIQVNAFRQDGYAIDSSDADWPTLGFYIPVDICSVEPAPPPVFPYDSIFKRDIPILELHSEQPLPSTYDDYLNLTKVNRRDSLAPEPDSPPVTPPPSPIQRLKRTLSAISGIGKCGN